MLRRNINSIIISITLDIISLFLAVLFAAWLSQIIPLTSETTISEDIYVFVGVAFGVYTIIFFLFSLYDPDRVFRAIDEYYLLSIVCFIAGLVLAGILYFTGLDISRITLLYFWGFHFLFVVSWRLIIRLFIRANITNVQVLRRVLLIGGGEAAQRALRRLDELNWAGVELIGYLAEDNTLILTRGTIPYLGHYNDINQILSKETVDDILVALPAESYDKAYRLVSSLFDKHCNIWIVPDYFSLLLYGGHIEDLNGVPIISLKTPTLTGYQRVVKRAFDLIMGLLLMVIVLPIMGIIYIAIKIDSPGPAIYKQRRVGENGRLFWMYKFRSMVQDADSKMSEVLRYDVQGNLIHKMKDDPRVTKIGRFIRRKSLDELPQFFNVLKGEMSIVGPRPELPFFVDRYETWQRVRFAVPQGITGWWQINGRSDKPMHLHTEDDLYYVRNYTILLDIKIIIKTAFVVFRGKGAF